MEIIPSRGIHFAIFIGKNFFKDQGANIVAVVMAETGEYIPYGKFNFDGSSKNEWIECFTRLKHVGTFIEDWFSIVQRPSDVSAVIYLNKKTIHKSFNGHRIVEVLDKIDTIDDLSNIQSFNDIL